MSIKFFSCCFGDSTIRQPLIRPTPQYTSEQKDLINKIHTLIRLLNYGKIIPESDRAMKLGYEETAPLDIKEILAQEICLLTLTDEMITAVIQVGFQSNNRELQHECLLCQTALAQLKKASIMANQSFKAIRDAIYADLQNQAPKRQSVTHRQSLQGGLRSVSDNPAGSLICQIQK